MGYGKVKDRKERKNRWGAGNGESGGKGRGEGRERSRRV